jgi:muconate cycloisomerase
MISDLPFQPELQISAIRLYQTEIPFQLSFNHATQQRAAVTGIVLQFTSACGRHGFGEVLPRAYVSGETDASVVAALRDEVLPALAGQCFASVGAILHYLDHFYQQHPALAPTASCVRTAVDLALLDLAGQCLQQPLMALLSGRLPEIGIAAIQKEALQYSGTYGLGDAVLINRYQRAYQALDLQAFKLKVGIDLDAELALLRNLQQAHPQASWRIDANGAWSLTKARQAIPQFLALGVQCIEQPLAASDRAGYLALFADFGEAVPLMLDESFCRWSDLTYLLDAGFKPALNLRVSKCGGILSTLALATQARQHGLMYQLGAQVGESVILTRAGQLVASLLGDCRYHEGAFGDYLLCHDLQQPSLRFGVKGLLPTAELQTAPGLALQIDQALLNDCCRYCDSWYAGGRCD